MSAAGDPLRTVNWTTGMLLTPDHFRTSDAFVSSSVAWLLRHCLPGSGLVGSGPRVGESERGLARFDPRIEVQDDGTTVRIAVVEGRGITPSGDLVDIGGSGPVRAEFTRKEMAGVTEPLVHVVVTGGREAEPGSGGKDSANPNQAAFERPAYRITLGAPADVAQRSLVVGRLKRASETLGFELDGQFIPACAMMLGHSTLYSGWARLQSDLSLLAGQFAELHRAVGRYCDQVAKRGIDVRADLDILAFVERTVLALDHCAYEIMDPASAPDRVFQEIDRAGRRIALALDLSPSTMLYFQALAGADASYTVLLEEERAALGSRRQLSGRDDLRRALDRAEDTIARIRRLLNALEGKYLDWRINRSLDAVKFLLDRGGEHFYVAVATPGHPQREGDLLTFVFGQLSLTGRHEYRLVLLGDPQGASAWQVGDDLRVDFRINAEGGSGRPTSKSVPCEIPGQRNFSVNFDTPAEVNTISGLNVQVQPAHRVRGAILFQRKLGLAADLSIALSAPPVSGAVRDAGQQSLREVVAETPAPTTPSGPPKITIRRPNT